MFVRLDEAASYILARRADQPHPFTSPREGLTARIQAPLATRSRALGGITGQIAQVLRETRDAVAGWHVARVREHAEHGACGTAPYPPRLARVAEVIGRVAPTATRDALESIPCAP